MLRPSQAYATMLACAAFTLAASPSGAARHTGVPMPATQPSVRELSAAMVAQQLGVKLSPGQTDELGIGASKSGMLTDSTRLVPFGLTEVRNGARVTLFRIAQERVRVEVDEIDPVPRSRGVTLRLYEDGRLGVIPR